MDVSDTGTFSVVDEGVEERLKRVVHRIYDLPSFPLVIEKLMEVAEDPGSSSKDLAEVMGKDQGLSAKILKLVNSAFYAFSSPVSSLQHAITLLGYNSVKSLAMSVSVKGVFKEGMGSFPQERFWEHSLATALGARMIAELNRFPLKEDVFTAGLLHDTGILLEARYFATELEHIQRTMATTGMPMTAAEEKQLGVCHCVLGAWLAERWRLPPTVRESVRWHHEAEKPEAPNLDALDKQLQLVVRYVTVANLIVRGMGFRHEPPPDGDADEDDTARGKRLEELELPEHLSSLLAGTCIPDFTQELCERFQDSRDFLTL